MSVLFLFFSVLVLIYLGIGGIIVVVVLFVVIVIGLFQDYWYIFSILFGGVLLVLVLILVLFGDFCLDKLSCFLLGWVCSCLLSLFDIEVEVLKLGFVDWDGELFFGDLDW